MNRFKELLNAESADQAIRDGRSKLGKSAADRLAGLTPEQLAQIEKTATKLTPAQLQGVMAKVFANLDPATLSQIADKFAASGATVPGDKRTDPATLSVLAATAMKGRVGGIASLLMILAGSRLAGRAGSIASGQAPNPGLATARQGVSDFFTTVTTRGTQEQVAAVSARSRLGIASLQQMVALAKSPLARKVMKQLGPTLLKMAETKTKVK